MTPGGRQKGLSLLEMLVVFVVVSLVSVVLLQGFGFGLSLYERVTARSQEAVTLTLTTAWFRQVNASLVAPKEKGQGLEGGPGYFEATSVCPLLAEPGLPVRVSWNINDESLLYREGEELVSLMPMPRDAELRYRDKTGAWHSNWPARDGDLELPVAIAIDSGDETLLLATTRMRLKADFVLEESRRERL